MSPRCVVAFARPVGIISAADAVRWNLNDAWEPLRWHERAWMAIFGGRHLTGGKVYVDGRVQRYSHWERPRWLIALGVRP